MAKRKVSAKSALVDATVASLLHTNKRGSEADTSGVEQRDDDFVNMTVRVRRATKRRFQTIYTTASSRLPMTISVFADVIINHALSDYEIDAITFETTDEVRPQVILPSMISSD